MGGAADDTDNCISFNWEYHRRDWYASDLIQNCVSSDDSCLLGWWLFLESPVATHQ